MAFAALEKVLAGQGLPGHRAVLVPPSGRDGSGAHKAAEDEQRNSEAAAVFGSAGAFDPEATRAALTRCTSPVLLLAGAVDLNSPPPAMTELAELFPRAELAPNRRESWRDLSDSDGSSSNAV
ncbi:alpha/beta fold hydrolase [Nonomuraea bangladeshensis]